MQPTPSAESVIVIAKPHPFRSDKIVKTIPYGQRVSEIIDDMDLESTALQARVFLDEQLIEKAYWHRVKPKAGHRLTIRVIPQGGSGAGAPGMKDLYRMVAMIGVLALAVAAPFIAPAILGSLGPIGVALGSFVAPGTVGGALLTLGVTFGGSLGILSLMPPASSQRLIGEGQ